MENLHLSSGKTLHKLFLEQKVSATNIAKTFLSRCARFNPHLQAFLEIFKEDVLKKAYELDQKLHKKQKLGKLAAVPIALKDNIHVKGKKTTCASKFLENYYAPFDATVTKLLQDEDALIIGKTNLDEFAMGSSTENSYFFPTKNPWDLSCSPGGSSGGSCVAVSARLCPIALGSDTGGSIRQPAAMTGTYGFKPTYGRVSRYGLVAFASSLDQIGPIANYSEDIALTMEVLGKRCAKDATSYEFPQEDYTEKESLEGQIIGVPTFLLKSLSPEVKENFLYTIERLKKLKATIKEVNLDILQHSISIYYILATAEASTNLARFDGIRYGARSTKAKNIDELYDLSRTEGFGKEVKIRILLGTYVLAAGYKAYLYQKAQKARQLVINAFDNAFTTCTLIAMPTAPTSAFTLGSILDPLQLYFQDIFTIGANLAGLPAISIPSGLDSNNKPLGIQFIAPQLHDVNVVSSAAILEKQNLISVPKGYE